MLINKFSEVVTGTTPSTKNDNYYSANEYMFITPEDLKNNRYIKSTKRYISEYAHKDYHKRFIPKDSIVIDCIGSDMGNVAITFYEALTNQQINAITNINLQIVKPLYLYYLLSTYKKYLHTIGSNGSTMPIISKTLFENIDINIKHNLVEQQHIVDIIGSLDDKIENNNKIIKKMNNLLNVKTNELLLYKTKKIQLNDIIEECKEKAEIELVPYSVINTGKVIIQNEQFNKEIAKNTKGKYKKIKKDYFVYNPSRINIGSIGVMEDKIGCVSPIYVVFKCNEEYKIYLQKLLTFDSMIKEINKRCSGSVRQALSFNDLCSIEIYDIEKEKLKIYNKYCDSIIRITKKLEQENKLLENQKKLYLAKFF